jgi:hypothetical protein
MGPGGRESELRAKTCGLHLHSVGNALRGVLGSFEDGNLLTEQPSPRQPLLLLQRRGTLAKIRAVWTRDERFHMVCVPVRH